jgi:transcriptional regulator NrdR family protein
VIKADGRKQLFDKEKIIQTCLRIGASREIAEHIANKIGAKVYNGMETRKILKMILVIRRL